MEKLSGLMTLLPPLEDDHGEVSVIAISLLLLWSTSTLMTDGQSHLLWSTSTPMTD